MRVLSFAIPVSSYVAELPALVVEPDENANNSPVLLFLHGKGTSASLCSSDAAIPGHPRSPQEHASHRPQCPALPSKDEWNWRDHVTRLAAFVGTSFKGRRAEKVFL